MRVNPHLDALPEELEDLWGDFGRSLARRNRSESTVSVYRKSFETFWTWAVPGGITHPAEIDYKVINRWTDHLLASPTMRNGRAVFDDAGDERPTPIAVVELDDLRRLLSIATGPDLIDRRDTAIIRVLLDTGARLGELVNMSGRAL